MDKILAQSPWMTITAKASQEVEIDVEGIIGGDWWDEDDEQKLNTKEKLRSELKAIAEIKAKKIIVNINSYGGDVNHGISMYELLVQNKAEVTTRVQGFTASIATVIAMAGDNREMSSNALFLVHKPMYMMYGNFNENSLDDYKDSLQKVGTRITDIYTKGGVDPSDVESLMNEQNGYGKWIDAEEAKEYGFIDEVYEPIKMAAVHNPEALSKFGITNIPKNYIDMNETGKIKQMFDELKTWINDKLNPETPEGVEKPAENNEQGTIMVAPEEINAKLTAFQETIEAFETNENAVAELKVLEGTHKEVTDELEALKAENKTQKQKLTEMEAKLTKANGQSTKVEGPEGHEDAEGVIADPELKALNKDLKSLRAQFTETHA